jgi:mannose-6-phosphate isomerase-like protein (cupin superfamily)
MVGEGMKGNEQASPPWGRWVVLDDDGAFKVKRIEVLPGKRLSYQKHFKREEHWYIVKGQARVTRDGQDHLLGEGMCISIGREVLHRIENVGSDLLVFIEVQRGEYFGEDDIVRIEDDFGRAAY